MKSFALIAAIMVLGLTGCTTMTVPNDDSARIPVVLEQRENIEIEQTQITERDGRRYVHGRARRIYSSLPIGPIHIEARFFDAGGALIVTESAYLPFMRTRRGPPPAVWFSVLTDPWPSEAAKVVVRARFYGDKP